MADVVLAAVGMLREAAIVEGPGVRAAVGGGRASLLAERLEAALGPSVRRVISVGLCGALDPRLKVGDIVIGTEVIAADGRWSTDEHLRAMLTARLPPARLKARFTPVCGLDIMVVKAKDKGRLWAESGAAVVDMESHVAARFAAAHGLPLAVVRVVSDSAARNLPAAVLLGIRQDGAMNLAGVLGSLAKAPGQLPALIRAGSDANRAFKALKSAWRICDLT
jgi:adenosylhomocysteine nucleosidase